MIAIDTNILVRYITEDDESQAKLVADLFYKQTGKEDSILVNNIVLCELVWVLSRGYDCPKERIIVILKSLLAAVELKFEDRRAVFLAVGEYENSQADFSDALIGVVNSHIHDADTYSFDKKALKIKYFHELESIL